MLLVISINEEENSKSFTGLGVVIVLLRYKFA